MPVVATLGRTSTPRATTASIRALARRLQAPDARLRRIGGARRRTSRDSLSLPHGYHVRGAVAGCVRLRSRAAPVLACRTVPLRMERSSRGLVIGSAERAASVDVGDRGCVGEHAKRNDQRSGVGVLARANRDAARDNDRSAAASATSNLGLGLCDGIRGLVRRRPQAVSATRSVWRVFDVDVVCVRACS